MKWCLPSSASERLSVGRRWRCEAPGQVDLLNESWSDWVSCECTPQIQRCAKKQVVVSELAVLLTPCSVPWTITPHPGQAEARVESSTFSYQIDAFSPSPRHWHIPLDSQESSKSFSSRGRVNKKCLTKSVCLVGPKDSGSYTNGAGAEDEARVALPFGIGLGILSGWVRLWGLRPVVAWVLCQGAHGAQGCCLHLGVGSALHLFYYSARTWLSI